MTNKNILIGISSGIAIYKIPELIRKLKKNNFYVKVVMTPNAVKLMSPVIFQTLTEQRVYTDTFNSSNEFDINHISLTKWADLILIAPATANTINKLCAGIADNLLLNVILASDKNKKILIAPAMNTKMYENPASQNSIKILKERGINFIGPAEGELACGDSGTGRFISIDLIYEKILFLLENKNDLYGLKILVSAGACREKIDKIRFITNYSTGKQGYNIAKVCMLRGADVTLISGYSTETIEGVNKIKIESSEDMYNSVIENIDKNNIFISAAAVADYTPVFYYDGKIKKENNEELNLKLKKTKDILKEISNKKNIIKIGFAAEVNNIIENGKKKLVEKQLDMIVVNDVSNQDTGFGSDFNQVAIITKNLEIFESKKLSKFEIANFIIDIFVKQIGGLATLN